MRGGFRDGAGRKISPDSEKKVNKNVYITNELLKKIEDIHFDGCNSFSQKCVKLMEIGMETMENNEQKIVTSAPKQKKTYNQPFTNSNSYNQKLTFIDLFAGIGGIRQGFEDDKTRAVFSSEWDKYAAQTYEANFGEVPFGDITKISEDAIPDHDVLLAGFPCQPFSQIGKRQGFAHETQGTLFFDVLRILKRKQPKMFLLENVKGLLTNDNGNTFRIILSNLEELGYSVFHEVLNAQDFGLPQRRERIVIVGFHPDLQIDSFAFPQGNKELNVPINSILEQKPEGYSISKHLQESYLFKKNDGKPQIVDFNSEIQVNTLVASYHKIQRLTGTFVKDGATGLRLFSELEVKRLMGFPDEFIVPVSRTQMYRQFGNSVAVPMIKAVADAMKEELYLAELSAKNSSKGSLVV